MQDDFDTNDPNLGIEIVGINQAGRESGNSSVTAGNNIPWLQDVDLDQNGEADACPEDNVGNSVAQNERSFTATAVGNIDSDAECDDWSINTQGHLKNDVNDVTAGDDLIE